MASKDAIALGVLLFIAVIVLGGIYTAMTTTFIPTGKVGVVRKWGSEVTGELVAEGTKFYRISPMESCKQMDIKVQRFLVEEASAATKDMQEVITKVSVNYRMNAGDAAWMLQNVGDDAMYQYKVIEPAVYESIKAVTAKFTAAQLINNRTTAREMMNSLLQSKFDETTNGAIMIVSFQIEDFQFDPEYMAAIKRKQTAEQAALEEAWKLEQAKLLAEQKVVDAEAEARALSIQAQAIAENPDVLGLRWIETWNGILPQYLITMGNTSAGVLLEMPG
jgi:regulator of protease activity HflC (stomatin/prohibitin superfamily)